MKRAPLLVAAVGLLLFAGVTLVKVRARRDGAGPGTERRDSGQGARVREFWEIYRQATNERITGNTAAAAESYARALRLDAQHEDALYYLGNMHLELGRYREAEAAWEKLAAVNSQSSRAFSRLGDVHSCPEPGAPLDLARAEADFRRAHEINGEETGPVLHLAELALVHGDLTGARRYLDAVIGANAGSVEAHFLKGYAVWRDGDRRQAAVLFTKAAELAQAPVVTAAASSEGDTKRGVAPLTASRTRCRAFESELAALKAFAGADPRAAMPAAYLAVDERILEFRRFRSPSP